MENFEKVVYLGDVHYNAKVFCKIKFVDECLSISGVEGPLANGDCKGSCG